VRLVHQTLIFTKLPASCTQMLPLFILLIQSTLGVRFVTHLAYNPPKDRAWIICVKKSSPCISSQNATKSAFGRTAAVGVI